MAKMEDIVLTPLDAIETHLNALVNTLTTSSTFSAAPAIAQSLLADDDSLTLALAQLKRHQDNYRRILELQAEAAKLEEQLRDIVRTCGDLRREVRDISPASLEGSDKEDSQAEVDYKTLLSFAARIGKHNAAASREADAESLRRKLEARQRRERSPINRNRINGTSSEVQNDGSSEVLANIPEASRHDLAMLDRAVAAERAAKGMAFPNAEILRTGELGHLQVLRETQGGDEKVDELVEEMLEAEAGGTGRTGEQKAADDGGLRPAATVPPARTTVHERPMKIRAESISQQSRQSGPPATEPPRKINLALFDEEDSD